MFEVRPVLNTHSKPITSARYIYDADGHQIATVSAVHAEEVTVWMVALMNGDEAAFKVAQGVTEHRPHHLVWRDGEWHDERCGCRYHPNDDNNSHGGAPHVHTDGCPVHGGE